MPALTNVLGPHAQADARADFVAGYGGGKEFPAVQVAAQLGDGDQRRQHHRTHMQYAGAMHVIELEALHLGAVDQGRVRRGQALLCAPHGAASIPVECGESVLQDAAPFQMRTVQRAAQRIKNQQLDALAHLGRNRLVAQASDKAGDAARVGVVVRLLDHA